MMKIKESFYTRQVKYGGYATLITLALAIGLVLVNLIIGRFNLQIDMTRDRLFSLSNQSIRVVEQINAPVSMYGLWEPGQENPDVKEVIDLYLARNKNLRYQTIDPERNPGFLSRFALGGQGLGKGSVIVEGAKGFRVILPHEMYDISTYYDQPSVTGITVEHRITNALIYVATGETPVVYEIMGHGEDLLMSLSLGDMIERENFDLKQLNLLQSGIPGDASALILNSPKADISRPEADMILDYLEQGGSLLLLADYRVQDVSMLNEILASYGIRFDYGIVIENSPSDSLGGNVYHAITDMSEHDITLPLHDKRIFVVMPSGMGISEIETKRRSVAITPLLTSSADSWLRGNVDITSLSILPSDKRGPVIMAAAVTDSVQQTRIVAAASGAMLRPVANFGQIPANLDFFMNSLTWLEDRNETLSVRSKNVFLLPLMMSGLQAGIFTGIFVLLIPLAFFVSGLVIWLKRRHL